MKKAIYVRSAIFNEDSIKSQVKMIRDYCQNDEFIEYVDNGVSGNEENRPGLNKLLEDAKNGVFDVLWITEVNRLARDYYLLRKLIKKIKGLVKLEVLNPSPELDENGYCVHCHIGIGEIKSAYKNMKKRQEAS